MRVVDGMSSRPKDESYPAEYAIVQFNLTKKKYYEILQSLIELEDNPYHNQNVANDFKEELDRLYGWLELHAKTNSYLHLELPVRYSHLRSSKVLYNQQWKKQYPEEHAIFTRFEEVKRRYFEEAERLRSLEPERDQALIEHLKVSLKDQYSWMEKFAKRHRPLVLELPPRVHVKPQV